nr:C40 family peptidase [Kingella denitrificans]
MGQIARQAGSGSTTTSRTENTARSNDDEIGQIARQSSVTASPSPAVSSSAGRGDVDDLIGSAMGFLGVAYRFGGASPSGFDCSGFMQYIFRKAFAVNLPRTSAEQANVGVAVNRSQLQPGDMVFFRTAGSRISHVGMYIGNDRFIHAPRTGKRIEITSLSNRYWSARYATARRVKRQNAQNFIRN